MTKKYVECEPNRGGRPPGAKTVERASVICKPPSCPKCGSTRREPYRDGPIKILNYGGVMDGQPYNRVTWRDTKCSDCGMAIRVREYTFEPKN